MKPATRTPDPRVDDELVPALEGAEPGTYVVAPVGDLIREIAQALEHTRAHTTGRPHRVPAATAQLVRVLLDLGYIYVIREGGPTDARAQ